MYYQEIYSIFTEQIENNKYTIKYLYKESILFECLFIIDL